MNDKSDNPLKRRWIFMADKFHVNNNDQQAKHPRAEGYKIAVFENPVYHSKIMLGVYKSFVSKDAAGPNHLAGNTATFFSFLLR